jgi:hypothetical protein
MEKEKSILNIIENLNEPSIKDYIHEEEGMEDIRLSTTLFNQVKVADFVSMYFSLTAVGLSIAAREKDYTLFEEGITESVDSGVMII